MQNNDTNETKDTAQEPEQSPLNETEPVQGPDTAAEESSEKEPAKTPKAVSAFRNAAEIEAQARRREEEKERARQAAENEAAYQAREEYAKELQEDKVDLIRLKQGVITDSDKVFREEEPEKHYTVLQRIGNWFYHAKWWLGIATFLTLLVAFLVYDYLSREDPDLRLLILSANTDLYSQSTEMCDVLEQDCEDYNGNGEVLMQCIYIPVSKVTMEESGNYSASYNTQVMVQFQTSTSMLVLTDADAEAYLSPDEVFADLEALYPDCPYVKGCRLFIEDTNFGELCGFSGTFNPGSYLALRTPVENLNSLEENEEVYQHAKALLDKIVPRLAPKQENAE